MNSINIYDLTGLFIRQVSETPTGIDRVDLEYARFLLYKYADNTIFIKQHRGKLIVLPPNDSRALIQHLELHWANNTSETQSSDENNAQSDSSLSFRIDHYGLWEPDLDMFFSMPFAERFNFLLKHNLRINLGNEFQWVDSGPTFLRRLSILIASSSRVTCQALIKIGRFVGILLHTKNIKTAFLTSFRNRQKETHLKDYIEDNYSDLSNTRFNYIYISYTRVHPLAPLKNLKKICEISYIFYLHDFNQIDYPEYFPSNRDDMITALDGIMDLNPDLVVNSELTKKGLENYCNTRNSSYRSVITASIGVENTFLSNSVDKETTINQPYFVVVSTIEPKKNHLLLLNIWRDLVLNESEYIPHLYIVGKRGWENENVIDMIERCRPIQDYVHELSDLKDSELISLVSGARALLFPSFTEGWGMPLVEALSLGTPVICSDISAFVEAGQNIPDYIEPIDGVRWRDTIIDYCKPESSLRSAQLDRISNFRPPTWKEHFALVENLFRP